MWQLNTSQYKEGNSALPLASLVRTGRRALGDGRMRGLLQRVYPFVSTFTTDLDVTVRLFDSASGPLTGSETFTFDQSLGEGGHFQSIFRRARFYELEFGSTLGQPWVLDGYDVDVMKGGSR